MKKVFIYSEEGCPWCKELKESLDNLGIKYITKDITKNKEEWEKVTKHSKVEYVPTALIVDETTKTGRVLAPDRDWEELEECVTLIQETLED